MFKIGADVYTTDGKAGKLMKVVIDPENERVTHLIVEKGLLAKTDRVVPLEAIAETGDDGIRLGLSTAELEELPQFNETEFRVPDPGWERISWDEALDAIAARLRNIREQHGAEAIAFSRGTSSGTGLSASTPSVISSSCVSTYSSTCGDA